MRARSTLRTATCSRSTVSPATTGGRTRRASPTASTGRSTARTCRSRRTIGQSYRFDSEPEHFPEGTGLDRPRFGHRRTNPGPLRAASSTSPTATGSTRTISPSAATRSTSPSAPTRPMPRSAICGSIATSIRRSRICATRKSCALAGRILFHRYWSVFGATVIDLTDKTRGPALAGRRVRAGAPPARHRI